MKIRTEFPYEVRSIENTWIPMADGTRLAARVWLPKNAEAHPVPAILEFIPYRKREGMARRDSMMHPYFAGHGYAAVRVDLRGSGDSEGVLEDEYSAQEQQDGVDVIRWLAAQPWCTGDVGMIGISWGGFNGLQIASHAPDALKAIVTVGSTDDRYADDVHYMGGCLLTANFTWAQTFFADLSRPPDPAIVGERWRDMWLKRLQNATNFIEVWLQHQTRDAYWRRGSVCEDFSRIKCPVFAVGGWADSYTNAVPRLLSGLSVARRGLIGPWGHDYPHTAIPGPAIGFLHECLRWWDHWLKGMETGVMDEPMLRVWMQEAVPASPSHQERPGRWLGIHCWPLPVVAERVYHLNHRGLSQYNEQPQTIDHSSPQTLGAAAGEWCPYGVCADQPTDQRHDDAGALCFDSDILREPVEILGAPVVELQLSVDQAQAFVAVRLNDVDPSGSSTRVSYGLLNLTHRESHEEPRALTPGEQITVTVTLCDTAYRLLPGHRIRLAISTAYWPTVWPSPKPTRLTLRTGESRLFLPFLAPEAVSRTPVRFFEPEASAPEVRTVRVPGEMKRCLTRDYITGSEEMTVVVDDGVQRIEEHGLEVGRSCEERYSIHPDKPVSATVEAKWVMTLARGDWQVQTKAKAVLTSTESAFNIDWELKAFSGGEPFYSDSGTSFIERHGL